MTVPLLGGVLPQLLPLVVPDSQLIISALAGFAVIIILITWLKMNPFLALTIGALGVGVAGGLEPTHAVESFAKGFGATMGSVGVLIGLGAMFGKLLADSGGADGIVDTLVDRSSPRMLPWTMALVGAVIGLPMFFEIGLVLLMPVIILVARRSGLPLMKIAIPTLAGLSAMHGLVPPHPGPLVAISTLNANLGLTLAFGVIVAIPTVIVAGPLFSGLAAKWAPVPVPNLFVTREDQGEDPNAGPRPSFAAALFSVLLPVILMMAKALSDVIAPDSTGPVKSLLSFLGTTSTSNALHKLEMARAQVEATAQELNQSKASLETLVEQRTAELEQALRSMEQHATEQSRLLSEVEQQRNAIRELSMPVIPVSKSTLVVPLVGVLDTKRLAQLQEETLSALQRSSARKLILDITGVPLVDTMVAQGLISVVQAAGLLGADVTLVGVRPEVAQAIVGLGIHLNSMRTAMDLQSALS